MTGSPATQPSPRLGAAARLGAGLIAVGALALLPAAALAGSPPTPKAPEGTARFSTTAYRTDTIDIPLKPDGTDVGGNDLEYKVKMKKGQELVFSWTVENVTNPEEFYYDFHGEQPGTKPLVVLTYGADVGLKSAGSFTAPFDGVHGWYLQNQSEKNVVVKLKIAGFYELVPPGEYGNDAGILPNK